MIRRIKIALSAVIILGLIIAFVTTSSLASMLNFNGKFSFDIGDSNYFQLQLDSEEVYHNSELLGAQINNYDRSSVRFTSVVHSDILKVADDYGFMFCTVKKTDTKSDIKILRAEAENYSEIGYKLYSCKGKDNQLFSDGYGNTVFDFNKQGFTRYKYLTAHISGVQDDRYLIARFYIRTRDKFHYSVFGSKFHSCIYSSTDIIDDLKSDIEFVGHRGAMDIAPENTLVSFEKAAQYGYPSVETDFWVTDSGDILCLHNEYLDKCGFPNINIKSLDVNSRFGYPITNDKNIMQFSRQYIPTIEEVIKKVSSLNLELFLHVKDKNTSDEKFDEIISILEKYNMLYKTTFVSSSPECCARLAKHKCKSSYLVVFPSRMSMENGLNLCKNNKINTIVVKFISGFPTEYYIQKAHNMNIRVGVYNANNLTKLIWLADNNCDFMMINNHM